MSSAMIAAIGMANLDSVGDSINIINGNNKGVRKLNVVGQTPPIPKQKRNKPCGCGSGNKAKKCCGEYAKQGESK